MSSTKTSKKKKLQKRTMAEIYQDPAKATTKAKVAWANSIEDKKMYVALRKEGFDKEASARISNSKTAKKVVTFQEQKDYVEAKVAQGQKNYKRRKKK